MLNTPLSNAIKRFSSVFGREGFDFGALHFNNEALDIPQELELTGEVREFYTSTSFEELVIQGELFLELFPMTRLAQAQQGWRWINTQSSVPEEDTQQWKASWLVVGDRNGDAIFSDLDDADSPIYGSIQKHKNVPLASSLHSFLDILCDCMLIERNQFNYDTQTESFELNNEFVQKIYETVTVTESPEIAQSFIDFFFD